MPGEGFMMHANQSVKMNRREKTNFLAIEDGLYSYEETPFVPQKASPKKLKAIEAKINQLKQAETKRFYSTIVIISLLFIGIAVYYLL